jgi:hypothetical protein
MMTPSVRDYYEKVLGISQREIEGTPDATLIAMDPEQWTDYFIKKHGMEPVEIDPARPMTMVEARHENGIYVVQPMIWTRTMEIISREGLAGAPQWFGFSYGRFFSSEHPRCLSLISEALPHHVEQSQRRINEYIEHLNSAINMESKKFPGQLRDFIRYKQEAVRNKHKKLDDLATTVGIPLVKRQDIAKVIPTAVTVRKSIIPIVPPQPGPSPQRVVLERDKFNAIMELIDSQCRQFERTPTSFQILKEEALRDILLSSLNAVFEGKATGEAFQGLGKVDIHLSISQGEVFVAELKFWDGPATLTQVIEQLLERLTWRDAFGVAIVLSKARPDFGEVLRSVEQHIGRLPRYVQGSFRKRSANDFTARFVLPSDSSSHAEILVVVYNLYTERRSRRTS